MLETVYLAGQITGLTYGEAMGWRNEAIDELVNIGYEVFSPMRHKRHLAENFSEEVLPHAHPSFRNPFERDLLDILRADYMIANLALSGVEGIEASTGTMIEMGMASREGVHIITILPPECKDNTIHPFIDGVTNAFVFSLEDAIALLVEYQPVVQASQTYLGTIDGPRYNPDNDQGRIFGPFLAAGREEIQ